jgi:hypothetical protein
MRSFATWALYLSGAIAAPASERRQALSPSPPELTVELNYAIYTGYINSTSGLNIWKGYVFLPCCGYRMRRNWELRGGSRQYYLSRPVWMSFLEILLPDVLQAPSIFGPDHGDRPDEREVLTRSTGYAMPLPPLVVYAGRLPRLRRRIVQSNQRVHLVRIALRRILLFPMRRNFQVTKTVCSSMYMHQRPSPPRNFPSWSGYMVVGMGLEMERRI